MFDRELNGRVAKLEVAVYDGIMAEFSAEKAQRAQKFMRTHIVRNDGRPQRKDKRKAYRKEMCDKQDPWYGFDHIRNFRRAEAERTNASDYRLESEADELERALCAAFAEADADLAEYRRKENLRKESERLNEWLKYA